MFIFRTALTAAAILAGGAAAAQSPGARATLSGPDGTGIGTVTLTETAAGVLIAAELGGLPEGPHGFHIHETGACTPDFGAAGGHYNPTGAGHGFLGEGGPHAGDMPNIHVPASGALTIEVLNAAVTLAEGESRLLDEDGSAIVIHSGPDDYSSQPAGDAGDRIACGVIEPQ